ncbi:MAG: ABC transporter permease [Chloroflexi bacterium]|nr:ABC transporter permease [Chloroflexota bacterium]MDA1271969.1 ABC transporter permease [Chloroflexota bacterium]PKB58126.1 MAG: ABC transporter permease [SAR202 cluster bacterium Casp-Chloro-G2]
MSPGRTTAIANRIIQQMLRDRRSLALILVAPIVVMALVGFTFTDQREVLDRVAPALLAVFALFFTFILTGVSFLRERAQGTLERLMTTPVGRWDILLGYLLGFLLFATIQTVVVLMFTVIALQINYQGDLWQIFVLLSMLTVVSVSLGVFVSTFASNEFQVVQFIPMVFVPQIFLSGIFLPIEDMPRYLEIIARLLPLTYAVEALQDIMLRGQSLADVATDLGVLAGFAAVLLTLAAVTVRRP